ncbi:MAG TPA: tetratricopeptide repeat protein, partial [Chloroflexia bacterium]|nr:tetratricopeptide repeat protein [Chloroflexia bacterium]
AAAAAAARPALPPDARLRDLGTHRLADLLPPEHIYQLLVPGLPHDFPPLWTLDLWPNNLSPQLHSLVGRESAVAAATHALQQPAVRLVTLTGAGGSGKTRLALQVAAELLAAFPAGVFHVSLANIQDPALLLPAIARALGVPDSGRQLLAASLQDYLRDRPVLLLLDNLEQVAAAPEGLIALLAAAPGLKVLATSRVALHLPDAQELAVPPLAMPDLQHLPPLADLAQVAALAVFIARAQEVQPSFTVTAENARAVAEICVRLDGLPLALELAAARIGQFAPAAMLGQLAKSAGSALQLLTAGAAYLPARQRTLRGTIGWSYALLAPAEQQVFRQLAVFAGGCTISAAQQVLGAAAPLPPLLEALRDNSLLREEAAPVDERRFRMLETIREYAWEQLADNETAAALQDRHARFFLARVEQAEPEFGGPQQELWVARLESELDNLRAAFRWLLQSGATETACRLCVGLGRFWLWRPRGHIGEGHRWLEAALARIQDARPPLPPGLHASVLNWTGALSTIDGDFDRAVNLLEQSVALSREVDDQRGVAQALTNLIWALGHQGAYARAGPYGEESLAISRALGNKRELVHALYNLGCLAIWSNNPTPAAGFLAEGLGLARERGDSMLLAQILNALGDVARLEGDYGQAAASYEESLSLFRVLGDEICSTMVLHNLGQVALRQGDLAQASHCFAAGLARDPKLGDITEIFSCLAGLGEVAAGRGQAARAARLLGAAEALFAARGVKLGAKERRPFDQAVAHARAHLDPAAFAAAWAAGQAATLDAAIADALAGA